MPPAVRCLILTLAALISLVAAPVCVARADASRTMSVSGQVRMLTSFTLDALRGLPSRTESVTYTTDSGQQSHTYTGCDLDAVIAAADPEVDGAAEHPSLTIAILATGADGYSAALSWGDISPSLAQRPALVAYSEDGAPLDQPRLVVPSDLEGARYVKDLTQVRVVNLAR
jgi:Oxidoreductase molybdopterin binding domain